MMQVSIDDWCLVASVRWCWLSRSPSWRGSWKSFENPRISLGRIRLEVLLSGIYVDLLLSVGRTNPAGEQKHLDYIILCYAGSSLHGILESTDRLAKKIRRFLKNNLPIFKLVFADFRMTQNYVYTKFKDWVLKKSRNQEFHFSLGISRLFCDYFIPRYARDEIITKQSRNPLGKVKFSDFDFSSLINP